MVTTRNFGKTAHYDERESARLVHPASEIPGTSVQESTKNLLKGTAYHSSVLHGLLSIQDNLSVQEDGLSLSWLLFDGSPHPCYASLTTPRLYLRAALFDQSPTLSIHEKTKNSSRDDARQITLKKLYVLVWGRWNTAGLFKKLLSAGTEPREKSVMLQIVLGERLSFLDHCFMLHKGDRLLWSSGRLTAFPFCHSGTSHSRCLLQREEV